MTIARYRRFYAVHDDQGEILAVCVYKKGATAVVRTIEEIQHENDMLFDERAGLRRENEALRLELYTERRSHRQLQLPFGA